MFDRQHVEEWSKTLLNHLKSFQHSLRLHRYERSENGFYLPEHKVMIGGVMGGAVRRNGELIQPFAYGHNVVTDQGLNSLLNVYLHDTSRITTWYLAPFLAGSPAGSLTAALFPSTHTETSAYDESTRQEFDNAASTAKSTTNNASMATFTGNADITVLGLALLSVSTKQSTSGVCFAAGLFSSSRHLATAGDELLGKYTFTAADA